MTSLSTLAVVSQAALVRVSHDRLSFLEKVPNDIKVEIIKNLLDSKSVLNLAMTGPVFGDCIIGFEGQIATTMVRMAIPEYSLPVAMAVYHASKDLGRYRFLATEWSESDIEAVTEFMSKHLNFACANATFPRFTLKSAHPVLFLHSTIRDLAVTISTRISKVARPHGDPSWKRPVHISMPGTEGPTATEIDRFIKALYIFQLVCQLFPTELPLDETILFDQFWRHFAPWELWQVIMIQHYLELHLFDSSRYRTSAYFSITTLVNRAWQCFSPRSKCDPAYFREKTWYSRGRRLRPWINFFIIQQGLDGLGKLALQAKSSATTKALHRFYSAKPRSCRFRAWNVKSTGLWVPHDIELGIARCVTKILKAYPAADGDNGPAETWMHTLLLSWPALKFAYKDRVDSKATEPYICLSCRVLQGCCFWDEKRMREFSSRLPTLDEIKTLIAERDIESIV
ncbi:hypothetical protein F4780DRAFT_727723 [Xylariomycetidae sp. FL0641]|nr:hypothetical protein F4780DRAFT_727723 [Xylariomycetidae sp. FL0641]